MKYIRQKLNTHPFENFLHHNIIMNWSNLNKCTLILVLGCSMHVLWLFWKLFILYQPTLWHWINLPILKFQIIANISTLLLLILLMIPCIMFKKNKILNSIFPYIVLNIFVLLIIRDCYLIGIFSPATVCGYIGISGIGFLLFERKFVYVPLIIATIILIILSVLTTQEVIPYAPIFSQSLLVNHPFTSPFWVGSMAYFSLPILVVCFVLAEILLTQWRYRESVIAKLSQTDSLTNLLNRRSFNEKLQSIHDADLSYTIIILDLDHFKSVNDHYGHYVGDRALTHVAEILTAQIRCSDLVARYGGEEFIITLQNTTTDQAMLIAEQCRQAISKTAIMINAHENIHLTASFGIAMSNQYYDFEKVIHCADQALYLAKQQGRNQVQIYQ